MSGAPGFTEAFQDELAYWREHPNERDEQSPAWNWAQMRFGERRELRECLVRLASALAEARSN